MLNLSNITKIRVALLVATGLLIPEYVLYDFLLEYAHKWVYVASHSLTWSNINIMMKQINIKIRPEVHIICEC